MLEESRQANEELQRRIVELGKANRTPRLVYQLIRVLTESESRLLKLLVEGHNYTTAADELGVSYNTVKFYMRHVYEAASAFEVGGSCQGLTDRLVK